MCPILPGNLTTVTCTESANQSSEEEKQPGQSLSPGGELFFEAPLLVIGAVLSVIGFLLLIAAISVWRRYRQDRRRQAKCAKARRDSSAPAGCNYEMITYEQETHVRASSTSDNRNSLRKLSLSSVAHSDPYRKGSTLPVSTQPQGGQPVNKLPSAGIAAHKTKAVCGGKVTHNSDKKNTYEDDNVQGNYSLVEPEDELDYEDISPAPVLSVKWQGTGVATPLAFLKAGELQHALRKTDYMNQANAKTTSLPQTELLNEDSTYSHLDRLGNLRSHCLIKQNRDHLVSNNAGICHSTEVKNSTEIVDVNMPSSDKPIEIARILKDDEGMLIDCEEQDHIYDALEKQEDVKGQQTYMKPTSNDCRVTKRKSVNDISRSKEETSTNNCDSKLTTAEANQSDLNENKYRNSDSTYNVGKGDQNADMEIILRKEKEIHVDKIRKPSSMLTDNRTSEQPMTAVRQSGARFKHELTEAQTNTSVSRTFETDSQESKNSDTNDEPQIIEAIKDRRETKSLSRYVNILPVERSMSADRQSRITDLAVQDEIQEDATPSTKNSNVCYGINDETDGTETKEFMPVKQQHGDLRNTLPTDRPVSMNGHCSASDHVNPNDTHEDPRISYKDGEETSRTDLQKCDDTVLNSNLSETNTASEANQDDCCTDDDALKGYTIVENIVYESLSGKEL